MGFHARSLAREAIHCTRTMSNPLTRTPMRAFHVVAVVINARRRQRRVLYPSVPPPRVGCKSFCRPPVPGPATNPIPPLRRARPFTLLLSACHTPHRKDSAMAAAASSTARCDSRWISLLPHIPAPPYLGLVLPSTHTFLPEQATGRATPKGPGWHPTTP